MSCDLVIAITILLELLSEAHAYWCLGSIGRPGKPAEVREGLHTTGGVACYSFVSGGFLKLGATRTIDRADEVTLSRKGAKSRTRIPGLRSKTTKARTHADRLRAANAELKKKLAEALEQQAATSEVLGVISRSPGELARVFQAMLENATRICEAKFGILFRYEGGVFHPAADR
jgi:hypothetical protein